jgi:hypothetical protein
MKTCGTSFVKRWRDAVVELVDISETSLRTLYARILGRETLPRHRLIPVYSESRMLSALSRLMGGLPLRRARTHTQTILVPIVSRSVPEQNRAGQKSVSG